LSCRPVTIFVADGTVLYTQICGEARTTVDDDAQAKLCAFGCTPFALSARVRSVSPRVIDRSEMLKVRTFSDSG